MIHSSFAQNNVEDRLNQLDERLTDMELSNLASKIDVGMDLTNLAGYFDTKSSEINGGEYNDFHTKTTLRLNFFGNVSDDLKVFASLQASFLGNNDLQTGFTQNEGREEQTISNKPYVRSAYFDYRILGSAFSFSMGRLPTTNGPPEHLRSGGERQGTYPVMNYSIPLDGMALTIDWHKLLDIDQYRKIITRTIFVNTSITSQTDPQLGANFSLGSGLTKTVESGKALSQMIEFEQTQSQYFKNLLAIAQASFYNFGSFIPQETTTQLQTGQYVDGFIYSNNERLADLYMTAFHLEIERIFKTNFDFYWQGQWTRLKARSNLLFRANGTNTVSSAGSFLTNNESQGTRFLLGSRYNFNPNFQVGFEWWHTNREVMPTDIWTDDFIQFGTLLGDIFHPYANYKLYGNSARIRFGFIQTDLDKKIEVLGGFQNQKRKNRILYTGLVISL